MIKFFLLVNKQGKVRLAKWYNPYNEEEQKKVEQEVQRMVTVRDSKLTNFLEYRNGRLIYRRYAGLYFVMFVDAADNELACFEAIHFFVELLDTYFENVCELDLVFNFHKVYMILDEVFLGGEFQENSKTIIMNRLAAIEELVA